MCCAPCSVYPVSELKNENMQIKGFFYNPNIHPKDEFERRMENVEKFSVVNGIPVEYVNEYKQDAWEELSGEDEQRCRMCYALRLDRTAAYAREQGFDAFTTTLLVSPYQKHELIKELGEECARRHGVKFYYKDFRQGFRQGQQQARDMGLYRQKFCGCIVSYRAMGGKS